MEPLKYIDIMIDSLKSKVAILDEIMQLNEEQASMVGLVEFDFEAFDQIVNKKSSLIKKLELLDDGFESIYEKIRQELNLDKIKYAGAIKEMQKLISEITDRSAMIQVSEERNKAKIEDYFKNLRTEYRSARTSVKVASTYYKAMSNLNTVDPQLMDKKK